MLKTQYIFQQQENILSYNICYVPHAAHRTYVQPYGRRSVRIHTYEYAQGVSRRQVERATMKSTRRNRKQNPLEV